MINCAARLGANLGGHSVFRDRLGPITGTIRTRDVMVGGTVDAMTVIMVVVVILLKA